MRRHLSFANVVSLIALFIALGGGAYAVSLERDSVKSKHIKNGQVRLADLALGSVDASRIADGTVGGAEIADGAITGGDVANDSIEGADVAEGTLSLPAGSVGPQVLATQPHVEASRITSQTVAADGQIALNNVPKISGFAIDAGGTLTAQVPGLYMVLCEMRAGNEYGVEFSNGETFTVRGRNEVLTKLVRLDVGTTVRMRNAEAIGFTLPNSSAARPAAQLILVRVGS